MAPKNAVVSPYSKMYLVGPSVYEKLLHCINDVDKKETLGLNEQPILEEEVETPATKYISQLNANDLEGVPSNTDLPTAAAATDLPLPPPAPPTTATPATEIFPEFEPQFETNDSIQLGQNPLKTPCELQREENKKKQKLIVLNVRKNDTPSTTTTTTLDDGPPGIREKFAELKEKLKNPTTYVCTTCNKTFHKSFNLNRHQVTMHKFKPVQIGKISCNICGKKFQQKWQIVKHMSEVHSPEQQQQQQQFETQQEEQQQQQEMDDASASPLPDDDLEMESFTRNRRKRSRKIQPTFAPWAKPGGILTRSKTRQIKETQGDSYERENQNDTEDEDETISKKDRPSSTWKKTKFKSWE